MPKNSPVSTSKLAKLRSINSKDLFSRFSEEGYLERYEDKWKLTEKGKNAGGKYRVDDKLGQYVVWPDDMEIPQPVSNISATEIGKNFGISAQKTNQVLSELGWIKKALKGWEVTNSGSRVGGLQKEIFKTGAPFVVWPDSISENKVLLASMNEVLGQNSTQPPSTEKNSFREKFIAEHRCSDGHMVRSRAEMLIDNWLYMAEITHAYERRLPIEEEVYSDFYIPSGKVYIEFWGLENNPKYEERKKEKLEIYNTYNFNLIELTDKEISNLDDYLPKLLLKFGIQTY